MTRFWLNVQLPSNNRILEDCGEWIGSKTPDGYGRFWSDVTKVAHRFIYIQTYGPIELGNEIDHDCWNRGCVNPEHLKSLTVAEHRARGSQPGQYAELVCLECEEVFDPKAIHQKYCSTNCRVIAWQDRQ